MEEVLKKFNIKPNNKLDDLLLTFIKKINNVFDTIIKKTKI